MCTKIWNSCFRCCAFLSTHEATLSFSRSFRCWVVFPHHFGSMLEVGHSRPSHWQARPKYTISSEELNSTFRIETCQKLKWNGEQSCIRYWTMFVSCLPVVLDSYWLVVQLAAPSCLPIHDVRNQSMDSSSFLWRVPSALSSLHRLSLCPSSRFLCHAFTPLGHVYALCFVRSYVNRCHARYDIPRLLIPFYLCWPLLGPTVGAPDCILLLQLQCVGPYSYPRTAELRRRGHSYEEHSSAPTGTSGASQHPGQCSIQYTYNLYDIGISVVD